MFYESPNHTCNERVGGSNPSIGSNKVLHFTQSSQSSYGVGLLPVGLSYKYVILDGDFTMPEAEWHGFVNNMLV